MTKTNQQKPRAVKLKVWALNHSAIEIASQCGSSRQAVYDALKGDRRIMLKVRDGVIVDAVEDFGKRSIWGFTEQ